jgi:hypothetical protein
MEDFEKDRKEVRKNHIVNKNKNRPIRVDEDLQFVSKASKARKHKLQELEEEELYEEWEEYFN